MYPLRYEVDARRKRATVVYEDQPTADQWRATIEQIFASPDFGSGFVIVLDRSKLRVSASTEYTHETLRVIDAKSAGGHLWLIIAGADVTYGMARMAEQLTKFPGLIRAFRSQSEAECWLRSRAN